ncbi:LPXTG cell wall anchor domain-containing protein [Streptomyces sp. NPDC090741]|uniref:LPXTG cell wall anchor domain-containing protein n=1 Tax=Streptomyces sp. NPDC090741 TaxID=3365967 RepID=UPI003830D3E8
MTASASPPTSRGGAASGSGGKGGLANTGADAATVGLLGAGLVAAGGLAVWWARRRGLLTFPGN